MPAKKILTQAAFCAGASSCSGTHDVHRRVECAAADECALSLAEVRAHRRCSSFFSFINSLALMTRLIRRCSFVSDPRTCTWKCAVRLWRVVHALRRVRRLVRRLRLRAGASAGDGLSILRLWPWRCRSVHKWPLIQPFGPHGRTVHRYEYLWVVLYTYCATCRLIGLRDAQASPRRASKPTTDPLLARLILGFWPPFLTGPLQFPSWCGPLSL